MEEYNKLLEWFLNRADYYKTEHVPNASTKIEAIQAERELSKLFANKPATLDNDKADLLALEFSEKLINLWLGA